MLLRKRSFASSPASAIIATAALLAGTGQAFAAGSATQTICAPKWVNAAHAAPYTSAIIANTTLLQAAITSCGAAGTASLPALVDLKANGSIATAQISSVNLASNIVIKVEAGFTLLGPTAAQAGYTGTGSSSAPAMLFGKDGNGKAANNVTLTGTGTIDGNGASWWAIYNQGGVYTAQSRPKFIDFYGSNIRVGANFDNLGNQVTGVTFPTATNDTTNTLKIKNAPMPHLEFESGSSNTIVDGVWIYAPPGRANLGTGTMKNVAPNTDGIDIVGVNDTPGHALTSIVQNCVIDVGDDNIAIKSNKAALATGATSGSGGAVYNVAVRNCVFGGGHGLSIGGQETGGVYNVTATNVHFRGTDFGLKVKTDNTAKDTGIINGVSYANVCMQNVAEPIQLTYLYAQGASSSALGTPPLIENIVYDNIVATNTSSATSQKVLLGEVTGSDPSSAKYTTAVDLISNNIRITNSSITGPAGTAPFLVTDGTLQIGKNSIVATATGTGGTVTATLADVGPTVVCPATITIPAQQ
ncbi:glycosyl hydrolase family 28 protein [Telmatospirillum sp.]|uniref:glycoside hydrolase family 28 protein n=1 Tax=Telmatospirillum sp. TaxID=2079197 RepID=UPI002850EE26|nr:glycosyl hydrolase family 28 protein [Telmatospirillum sp.]MDR3436369.1 glycosyl hydrolase family 28 protein [Telmatospirillum sp.]